MTASSGSGPNSSVISSLKRRWRRSFVASSWPDCARSSYAGPRDSRARHWSRSTRPSGGSISNGPWAVRNRCCAIWPITLIGSHRQLASARHRCAQGHGQFCLSRLCRWQLRQNFGTRGGRIHHAFLPAPASARLHQNSALRPPGQQPQSHRHPSGAFAVAFARDRQTVAGAAGFADHAPAGCSPVLPLPEWRAALGSRRDPLGHLAGAPSVQRQLMKSDSFDIRHPRLARRNIPSPATPPSPLELAADTVSAFGDGMKRGSWSRNRLFSATGPPLRRTKRRSRFPHSTPLRLARATFPY